MKNPNYLFVLGLVILTLSQLSAQKHENLWRSIDPMVISSKQIRVIHPAKEQIFHVDTEALKDKLDHAPEEFSSMARQQPLILPLPMPDGQLAEFEIVHSSIMDPQLQQKYPNIRTYSGHGIDDPTAMIRLDLTPSGFHAMILSASGAIFIDPYTKGNTAIYSSYYKKDFYKTPNAWLCEFDESKLEHKANHHHSSARNFGDCEFRSFRFAVAATGEYTAFHGGKSQAIAAQVTTMNRVNGVLEREVAIRLILIANNDTIVYTNGSSDPYSNGNPGSMIGQNQNNLDAVIGASNYDLGHVFGTNSGGLASLGVLCVNGQKARGVTGNANPVGDPFDIDYVAHEIGHQLGALHTFNGTAGACGGNGSSIAAFEPGSGSTIMAYAGICGSQNVQNNSDAYYHAYSLQEMAAIITNASCATTISTTNNEPVITHGQLGYVIPASTPFFLESAATDVDGDSLTYCWEQFDNQSSTQPPVATSTGGPNFRSLDPTENPRRYFPTLSDVVNGTSSQWEVLPSVSRTMNFKVTVRDNQVGGCTTDENASIQVDGGSGPFVVTQPSSTGISWSALSSQTISWDVAGTDQAPVNCSNVDILLSLDGGFSYPISLATNVPNTGTNNVLLPDTAATTARIMVVCSGGIFFDISDNDFTITANTGPSYFLSPSLTTPVICAPDSGVISLFVGSIQGYQDMVNLTASISPSSALTATFSNANVIPGNNTSITISNTDQAPSGLYTMTIDGTSTAGPQQTTINFEVLPGTPAIAVLSSPPDGTLGTSLFPQFNWQNSSGASTYTLQIATDSSFMNIVATEAVSSPSALLSSSLDPLTFYYWRVVSESVCDTNVSSPFLFFTNDLTCSPNSSPNVPVTIATFPTTITSTLSIPFTGTISDIKVTNLNGTHSWIADLKFSLASPSGTTVVLMDQVCGNQNNFDLEFSDGGSPYTAIPCPPVGGGTFQPSESLSAFVGEDPQGTWTLTVEDLFNQDGGSLDGWGLEICFNPVVTCNLTVSPLVTDITCNGVCDGIASISSSGIAPYTYSWSNGTNDSLATGLCAGNYTVAVIDDNGCLGASTFQVVEPPAFVISATTTDASCFGAMDGSVSFIASGGVPPYSVDLGGLDSTALGAGTYLAYITDAGGCTDSVSFTISSPPEVGFDFGPDIAACDGETFILDAGSLGMNYSYLWSTGETTPSIAVTDSGLYWLLATDTANCSLTDSIVIDFLPVPTAAFSFAVNNGEVSFQNNSSSGTYQWEFGDGNTSSDPSPVHTYADTGAYTVRLIVDLGNGCPPDTLDQIVQIGTILSNSLLLTGSIHAYPNPANEHITVEFEKVGQTDVKMVLLNHLGQSVFVRSISIISDLQMEQIAISEFAEGVYYLQIEAEEGWRMSDRIMILR